MTLAYAHQAIRLSEEIPLRAEHFARATGADLASAEAWLRGEDAPSGELADRLVELAVIVQRLSRVLRADAIPEWLSSPMALLEQQAPLDLIARGDYERVARVVSGFESPGFT